MFKKATKKQAKLRLAISGPSGSGKTYTALRIATGLGLPIAVIDTEHRSASKYSDKFKFDVAEMNQDKSIDELMKLLKIAAEERYSVLIIDSLTHAWQTLLEEVDKIAAEKYRGNTWSAWSHGTPKLRRLMTALLEFPGHLIVTMRSKTEWTVERTPEGKSKPVKTGLAPEFGKGSEYEFDMLMEMNIEHIAHISKDRTNKYQDNHIDRPGESLGEELAEWLADGEIDQERERQIKLLRRSQIIRLVKANTETLGEAVKAIKEDLGKLSEANEIKEWDDFYFDIVRIIEEQKGKDGTNG